VRQAIDNLAAAHNVSEQLHGSDVHVWLSFLPEIHDPALLDAYRLLLSAEERQRKGRFVFSADRHSYLVTHAMLRIVLSKYAPIQPQAWQFVTNGYGRPEIANADPSAKQINFNVSHAHGLVVVAVTRAPAVGVDVEEVRARPAPAELADRHFTPQEILALQALPENRQSDRFYEFWTLKEAYIKARGLGLSIPLNQFSFQFEGDRTVHFGAEPSLQDSAESWKFWQFCPSADHVLALCVHRGSAAEPRLHCRRCIPLERDELLEPLAVRESA
jgi:4'-phosphopantetheinyl transferase